MDSPTLVPATDRIDVRLSDLDLRLLSHLADGRSTRGHLSECTGQQPSWVGKRLRRLVDEGILERPARGLYELPWEYRRRGDVTVAVEPDTTARRIRTHLRGRDDLVPEEYREHVGDGSPLEALCYVAAEAYYYARGEPDWLTPQRLEWPDGSSHWFLRSDRAATDGGDTAHAGADAKTYVLDLSLPEPDPWLPFDRGEGRMFPSYPHPSTRTTDVLERLGFDSGHDSEELTDSTAEESAPEADGNAVEESSTTTDDADTGFEFVGAGAGGGDE